MDDDREEDGGMYQEWVRNPMTRKIHDGLRERLDAKKRILVTSAASGSLDTLRVTGGECGELIALLHIFSGKLPGSTTSTLRGE